MTRTERHAQIKALKEQGLTFRQIAGRLGLGLSTVTDAYYDPSGEKVRARKARNNGTCIDCGAPTKDSGAKVPPKRCRECSPKAAGAARKVWTHETCVAAIREWAAEHDGIYPTTLMWNPTHARNLGSRPHPDYVNEPERWPCFHTVLRECGTWRAAVIAAGYVPRERGGQSHLSRVAA
jgi:transposase